MLLCVSLFAMQCYVMCLIVSDDVYHPGQTFTMDTSSLLWSVLTGKGGLITMDVWWACKQLSVVLK